MKRVVRKKHEGSYVDISHSEESPRYLQEGLSEAAMGPDLELFLRNTSYEKLHRKELIHL